MKDQGLLSDLLSQKPETHCEVVCMTCAGYVLPLCITQGHAIEAIELPGSAGRTLEVEASLPVIPFKIEEE